MGERRSYRQVCPLACTLDLVGDRWTMLIVRDLSLGPRRYGDLLEGLPGIGEGLLAQRLRHLESEGIAQRTFASAPVNAVVYELTEDGAELGLALLPLGRWGMRRLGPIGEDTDLQPDHVVNALRSRFDASESHGVHEHYEFRVDGHVFTVEADDGRITVTRGAQPDPAVVLTTDITTLLELGMGMVSPEDARKSARLEVVGERDALVRYGRMLRLPPTWARSPAPSST